MRCVLSLSEVLESVPRSKGVSITYCKSGLFHFDRKDNSSNNYVTFNHDGGPKDGLIRPLSQLLCFIIDLQKKRCDDHVEV